MAKTAKNGHYINIKIASDVFDILERHCRMSGQTKTLAIERMIRACYGPSRKISDADIMAAQGLDRDCDSNHTGDGSET